MIILIEFPEEYEAVQREVVVRRFISQYRTQKLRVQGNFWPNLYWVVHRGGWTFARFSTDSADGYLKKEDKELAINIVEARYGRN